MGGKGGGGGGGGNWQDVYATNPKTGGVLRDANGLLVTKQAYAEQQAAEAAAKAFVPPPQPAAPAPAAATPAPAAPTPDPGPALATSPTGPVIGAGGGILGPTAAGNELATDSGLGGSLGESVLKPPKYWTGGLDQSGTAALKTGRDAGALKTTN